LLILSNSAKAVELKDAESTKAVIVQVDDLLTFRQFSKKSADDAIDVCDINKYRGLGG
jgi:coatomer subunit beta